MHGFFESGQNMGDNAIVQAAIHVYIVLRCKSWGPYMIGYLVAYEANPDCLGL